MAREHLAVHGSSPDPRVESAVFIVSRVGSGPIKRCSKSHGSDRVGSGRVPNLSGRVGSDLETKNLKSRVGS